MRNGAHAPVVGNTIAVSRAIMWLLLICVVASCARGKNSTDTESTPNLHETKRPNFLFIVADDLGYSDISRLGSEINTPNLDTIADNGILFTRFYAASMCAPTRAMLLTGVDHHRTGLGNMADLMSDNQLGQPGYEGYLNRRVATISEILRQSDYHTYMVGKWHLGHSQSQGPAARGFERSFILVDGGASHFADMNGATAFHPKATYREDGKVLTQLPEGFYSTRFYTDKLIEFIGSNLEDERPFFAYAAYTAPHWPLQAPDDIRGKYAGVYDKGYDYFRERRFKRMIELGLVPALASYPERSASAPLWDELTLQQQELAARRMEIYAAMIDDLDQNVGRLIDFLREKGQLENTVVVFLSDNGADGFSLEKAPGHIADHANSFDNSIENIGKQHSFSFTGPEWADVSEAPFRLYKTFTTEGGVRVPAAIWFPALSKNGGRVNGHNASVMDLVPTVLELAKVEHPAVAGDRSIFAPDGRSLVPMLAGVSASVRDEDDVIGFELAGRRAVIKGNWKILLIPPPAGHGEWELFDLATDPGEQVDLASAKPEKLAEMKVEWQNYKSAVELVLPPSGALRGRPPSGADE